jgi:D-amino-acid oxidase
VGYRSLLDIDGQERTGIRLTEGDTLIPDIKCILEETSRKFWWGQLPGINFKCDYSFRREIDFENIEGLGLIRFAAKVTYEVPVIRMPIYLNYLESWAERLGVTILQDTWIDSPERELISRKGTYEAVINCTGSGANELLRNIYGNPKVNQLSGQLIYGKCKEINRLLFVHQGIFERRPIYIVPRRDDEMNVVLGGSMIPVEHAAKQDLPRADPYISDLIYSRCRKFENALEAFEPRYQTVGIRPKSSPIHVKRDQKIKGLFHNYGHGGSGVTLSWGCGYKIVDLVADYFSENR